LLPTARTLASTQSTPPNRMALERAPRAQSVPQLHRHVGSPMEFCRDVVWPGQRMEEAAFVSRGTGTRADQAAKLQSAGTAEGCATPHLQAKPLQPRASWPVR
jgi:hypothetical protein